MNVAHPGAVGAAVERAASSLAWGAPTRSASAQLRRARWHRDRGRSRLRGVRIWAPPAWNLVAALALESVAGALARMPLSDPERAARLEGISHARMSGATQDLQRAYFAYPWLGNATIGLASRIGAATSVGARAALRFALATGRGERDHHLDRLRRIPTDGYEAFMAAWLALAEAAGYFRAGDVHVRRLDLERTDPPPPGLTRLDVPHTLSDALDDIDDLTYAATFGSLVKIVRVGDVDQVWRRPLRQALNRVRGRRSRWIVEIPGTDHLTLDTTTNPADPQANLRETLGLVSNQRRALARAILEAMTEAGISDPQALRDQEVLLIGHSQGAMVAMALAAEPLPYTVAGVVSAGGPIGRMRAPDGVSVLALRHIQDPIPLFGGRAGEVDPRIAVYERSLPPVAHDALYYAHAASTYAETARAAGDLADWAEGSAVGRALRRVDAFFPQPEALGVEPGRVFIYELYQDIAPTQPRRERTPS